MDPAAARRFIRGTPGLHSPRGGTLHAPTLRLDEAQAAAEAEGPSLVVETQTPVSDPKGRVQLTGESLERALTEAHRQCEENKQKQRFAAEHFDAWYKLLMIPSIILAAATAVVAAANIPEPEGAGMRKKDTTICCLATLIVVLLAVVNLQKYQVRMDQHMNAARVYDLLLMRIKHGYLLGDTDRQDLLTEIYLRMQEVKCMHSPIPLWMEASAMARLAMLHEKREQHGTHEVLKSRLHPFWGKEAELEQKRDRARRQAWESENDDFDEGDPGGS